MFKSLAKKPSKTKLCTCLTLFLLFDLKQHKTRNKFNFIIIFHNTVCLIDRFVVTTF